MNNRSYHSYGGLNADSGHSCGGLNADSGHSCGGLNADSGHSCGGPNADSGNSCNPYVSPPNGKVYTIVLLNEHAVTNVLLKQKRRNVDSCCYKPIDDPLAKVPLSAGLNHPMPLGQGGFKPDNERPIGMFPHMEVSR